MFLTTKSRQASFNSNALYRYACSRSSTTFFKVIKRAKIEQQIETNFGKRTYAEHILNYEYYFMQKFK